MAEDKIARICWNTKGWRKPSGAMGKSKYKKAFEHRFGFGHEEWLLDTTKLIDGWHYGWLQPIGLHRKKYVGQTFNISLYSIDGDTRDRWWVRRISDVVVTAPETSSDVYLRYKKEGWLEEMEEQLRGVRAVGTAGRAIDEFRRTKPEEFVVIQFRPDSLDPRDDPMRFSKRDRAVRSKYYILLNQTQTPKLLGDEKEFTFVAGHRERKGAATFTYEGHSAEIDLVQNRMQGAICRCLSNTYGETNVGTEVGTYGSQIDIAVRDGDGRFIFYEIKTSYSLRLCIREALGQLLEYAYYPGTVNAKKLVVVSDKAITLEAEQYLDTLRKRFGLPIHYQRYDPEKEALEETLY